MFDARDDETEMYSCDDAVERNSSYKRNPSYFP